MPTIFFSDGASPIVLPQPTNLMQALLAAGKPVASSCKGDGVCGRCIIQILSGAENLSPKNATELFLYEKYRLRADQRISCQTEVLGDVKVHASYW